MRFLEELHRNNCGCFTLDPLTRGSIPAAGFGHGLRGEENSLSYDISKAGLEGGTRTLAIELGPRGVLVNALAPGFVNTRMSIVDGRNELESEWFRTVYVENRKLPLRRAAEPSEIAAHAAWLCSEENTYVTGQSLRVDGGLTVTF